MKKICSAVLICMMVSQVGAQQDVYEMDRSARQSVSLNSSADTGKNESWAMKQYSEAGAGEQVSSPGYRANGWLPAVVPGTVLNSLVYNKIYPEPYYGDNNRRSRGLIPDLHETGAGFYHYWFRKTFQVPSTLTGKKMWLKFHGINYRATVWLNGKKLGDMAGMFQPASFDVTNIVNRKGDNVVAVEVRPVDTPGDVFRNNKKRTGAVGENNNGGDGEMGKNVSMLMSVGWDFSVPDGTRDRNTGIWRDVELYSTGEVVLAHPFVQTYLPLPDTSVAMETVSVEVSNTTQQKQLGRLTGVIAGTNIRFQTNLVLQPGESRQVIFRPADYPQLKIKNPKLWWPVNKGGQHLYELTLRFEKNNTISHQLTTRFGVRQVQTDRSTPDQSRRFIVNGHPVFIRGTNWVPEAMLRGSAERTRTELRYTRQGGFNLIRLWAGGIAESDEFYRACDELGLLVWNEFWITGDTRFPADTALYFQNLEATVKRIRSHPSVAYYVAANESKEIPGTQARIFALDSTIGYQEQSECCGVHDGSPYKYENPMQYFENTASPRGSRVDGFNPEYGTPCLPLLESLKEMMPGKDLWPINDSVWNYLDGNGFHNINTKYRQAVNEFGPSNSIEEYAKKAQLVGALNYRAIGEVWNYNKFGWGDRFASGFLFWYNNSPLPQTASRMYDWYLRPTAALYYSQNGLAPLHPQFDYLKNTVSVYNDYRKAFPDHTVEARIYDMNSRLVHTSSQKISIPADGTVKDALQLSFSDSLTQVHFIKLSLKSPAGKEVAEAFYWRSTDAYKGAWTMTGPAVSGFADINRLPQAKLNGTVKKRILNGKIFLDMQVKNVSDKIAFFTQVRLTDRVNAVVPAVFYSDNFFSLLPGEMRMITMEVSKNAWNRVNGLSAAAFNTSELKLKW
ncbi:beta galactosidase jelly roll domain-containing protein [Niabella yanshanensis]|uniref:Beta galactosidase jelly roll domain-containing protein n=1 Tax=Niabella yanshanensis TaxID=577386 RepID=A0ABZ0W6P5_9BACT|nr:sugar-binding domain-containing protein [Niabella yanshanensis]WQD38204.1 beta galactosidase jelly roll domain-containing protein [Niabella yanshanensis]